MRLLSVIIPAYNEAQRIEKSIRSMKNFKMLWLDKWPNINLEIVYVIEKSSDDTLKIAQQLVSNNESIKIIANNIHLGKGYAVQTGILNTSGDIKLFMDLDLSTDLSHIKEFYDLIFSGEYDIVIGDRKSSDSIITKQQPLNRRVASFIFNLIVSLMGLNGIRDTQCGFKAFSKKTADYLFHQLHFPGFSFDVEILYKAKLLSCRIKSSPVKWQDDRGSKVNLFYHGIQMLLDMIYLKMKITPKTYLQEYQTNQRQKGPEKHSEAA